MAVYGTDEVFNVKNNTPIPIKVTVDFEGKKKSKEIKPATYFIPISIKLPPKGWIKEVKNFTLSTPSGATKIDVNQKSGTFFLSLSGPESDAQQKPIYKWALSKAVDEYNSAPVNSGTFK